MNNKNNNDFLTIQQIKNKKEKLEINILNLIDNFEKETKVSISQINLYTTNGAKSIQNKHINFTIDFGI